MQFVKYKHGSVRTGLAVGVPGFSFLLGDIHKQYPGHGTFLFNVPTKLFGIF
jgi:hypothetical protein